MALKYNLSCWLCDFPSGDVQVNLWMLRCENIVLLTIRSLDVVKFTTRTPLSLLISCKLIPNCWFENSRTHHHPLPIVATDNKTRSACLCRRHLALCSSCNLNRFIVSFSRGTFHTVTGGIRSSRDARRTDFFGPLVNVSLTRSSPLHSHRDVHASSLGTSNLQPRISCASGKLPSWFVGSYHTWSWTFVTHV
jgi:hypothetical protein